MKTIPEPPNNPQRALLMKAMGYNDWGYDNLIHQFYVTWCEAIAQKFYHNNRDLINSESLYSYYCRQWQILVECKMVTEYGGYMQQDIPDSRPAYYRFIYELAQELERYYPASLIRPITTPAKPKNMKYEIHPN
ncbi:hypothetical protein [Chryseobacterium sp. MFBS3-17]|uniref:hypothetical protein n=1 Tax=Chryseobacterium sp. MFBS3-17 TaxID=2886689 RepID=UPI001D0E3484|nr:hypothetical protein [Chryseobacterium sp. MFBS3-17]MCC2590327.1 hypothetical protein [Chryseobacterium sp. MFBS3-17]